MNKQEFIETMEYFEGFDYITIRLADDDEYVVGTSDIWVGGECDKWGSDILSNVMYDTYDAVVHEVANHIYDELGVEVVEVR